MGRAQLFSMAYFPQKLKTNIMSKLTLLAVRNEHGFETRMATLNTDHTGDDGLINDCR
jgi:hypothetical protein